jgi:hypothetical protein
VTREGSDHVMSTVQAILIVLMRGRLINDGDLGRPSVLLNASKTRIEGRVIRRR